MLVMAIRNGAIVRNNHFKVEWEEDPTTDLGVWLTHYYLNHEDPPDELLLADARGLELLGDSFADRTGHHFTAGWSIVRINRDGNLSVKDRTLHATEVNVLSKESCIRGSIEASTYGGDYGKLLCGAVGE